MSSTFPTMADTLELKTEKQNAHSDYIRSVGFSPDGKTIVSGSDDRTLKVWDVANPRPHNEAEWEEIDEEINDCVNNTIKLKWHNKITGHKQTEKPLGVGKS